MPLSLGDGVFPMLEDAKDALAEKRTERKRAPLTASNKTFSEVVGDYQAAEDFTDLRASTQTTYTRALDNYVRPTFDDRKVSEITTANVADWLKSLRTIDRQRGQGSLSAYLSADGSRERGDHPARVLP